MISKILNFKALPFIFLLLLVGALIWIGFDYGSKRREVIDLTAIVEKKDRIVDSLLTVNANLGYVAEELNNRIASDSVLCRKQNEDLQNLVLDYKKNRDYWKDWADKLETGEFCVEKYGFFKQKKRLVPCKNE